MAGTTQSTSTTNLGLAYDAFLFASIPDDGGQAPLNTVSVLARLDIDPWQEAAELTRLPRETAIQRLTALLVRLPGPPNGLADAETIAERLVALLPALKAADDALPARTAAHARSFDATFVAISFGFYVIVILTSLNGARTGRASIQSSANPATASSLPTPPQTPRR